MAKAKTKQRPKKKRRGPPESDQMKRLADLTRRVIAVPKEEITKVPHPR